MRKKLPLSWLKINSLKKFIVFTSLLCVVILGFWLKSVLRSPAVGSVGSTSSPEVASNEAESQKPQFYNGSTITFNLPENFRATSTKPTGPFLDSPTFYSTDHKGIQIAVGVRLTRLDSDSGVMFRREKKDVYKEQSIAGGVMFLKNADGQERTVYLQHNDKLLDIAATVDGTADLKTPVDKIQNSLQWK